MEQAVKPGETSGKCRAFHFGYTKASPEIFATCWRIPDSHDLIWIRRDLDCSPCSGQLPAHSLLLQGPGALEEAEAKENTCPKFI